MVEKNTLASDVLELMNKKITNICVYSKENKKTIGVIHIHNLINTLK